jgi:hypothetical protein
MWRRILEANSNMEVNLGGEFNTEVNFGGEFQCGGGFFLHGGEFVSHVKAKPVNLCRRSSTRGDLHNSIELGGSHLCHVFRLSQRNISIPMLFFNDLKCTYDST